MSEIYISRSTAVAARELGGEMMIMSATDSTLFSLNETATIIWNAADGQTPLAEIVECKICQEFNVQPEEAYRDAGNWSKNSRPSVFSISPSRPLLNRFSRSPRNHEPDVRPQSKSSPPRRPAQRAP